MFATFPGAAQRNISFWCALVWYTAATDCDVRSETKHDLNVKLLVGFDLEGTTRKEQYWSHRSADSI